MSPDPLRARRIGTQGTARVHAGEESESGGLHLHLLTIALALLAAMTFTLVEHIDSGHQHSRWCVIEIVVQSIIVLVGSVFARRFLMGPNALIIPPLLVVTMLMTLICEPIQRTLFGTGHPLEVLVMHSQSNLMLALATCGFRRSYRQLCALLSLFLAIFCLTKSTEPLVLGLFTTWAVVAVVWLIASHWAQVRRRAIAGVGRRAPVGWLITIPAVILTAISVSARDTEGTSDRLRGFMPSSGGVHDHDDHAHGGVNDGSGLVAGEDNIQSFGPIEDAPFADDDRPSLYDVFDDTFDDSCKKIKRIDRAIALPKEKLVAVEKRIARSRQAGREFSTLRQKNARNKRDIADLDSHALFYVAGRTPVHLRLETFDVFDGINWFPSDSESAYSRLKLVRTKDRGWLRFVATRNMSDLFNHRETHAVKVINLTGNIIPTPPHTDAVSIHLVDRLDMYDAFDNGLIALQRDNLPELTAIQVASNRVDQSALGAGYTVVWVPRSRTITTSLPRHPDMARVRELAESWTAGLPRGPQAIRAIVERLRTYSLERSAHAGPSSEFPVGDFLLRTRTGPEYLFASSAAVMLRSLGYPTRLVGGFYARAEKYEPKKRHTPVHADDAHFWCEVNIGGDSWLTVEPSPGYEVLQAPPGLLARLVRFCTEAVQVVRHRPWLSGALFLTLIAGFLRRRWLNDAVRTLVWSVARPDCNRSFALKSLRLFEHRLRLIGLSRPASTTFANWVESLNALAAERGQLLQFARIANRAAFRSGEIAPADRVFCEQLVRDLTYRRVRRQYLRSHREESQL